MTPEIGGPRCRAYGPEIRSDVALAISHHYSKVCRGSSTAPPLVNLRAGDECFYGSAFIVALIHLWVVGWGGGGDIGLEMTPGNCRIYAPVGGRASRYRWPFIDPGSAGRRGKSTANLRARFPGRNHVYGSINCGAFAVAPKEFCR